MGSNRIIGTNTMPGSAVAKKASRQVGKACRTSGSNGRQRSMAWIIHPHIAMMRPTTKRPVTMNKELANCRWPPRNSSGIKA